MAEAWYVRACVEWDPVVKSHIIRAGVPDDVYLLPNAWFQEEVKLGVWKLTFKDHISLTVAQRLKLRAMGARPEGEGVLADQDNLAARWKLLGG